MTGVPQVTVVIVNFNSGDLLARCIRSLLAQTCTDFEAIIVDNASTDQSLARAHTDDDRFQELCLPENLGFAAGNNRGVVLARAPWIATLNPDAFPETDWIAAFLRARERYPDVCMMGSTQISAADDSILDGAGDCYHPLGFPWRGGYGHPRPQPDLEGEVFGPCAAAAFYHTATFRTLGGFDETFFCYCEDVDLAFRFRLVGNRCLQLAEARVRHVGSAITGASSYFSLWHSARNRLWVFVKNMPFPLLVILLPGHLMTTVYLIVRHRHTTRFRPLVEGLISGFAGLRGMLQRRRAMQSQRRISCRVLARAFTWSLGKLRRQETDVRPYSSIAFSVGRIT